MKTTEVAKKLGEAGPIFTIDEATACLNMNKSKVEYYIRSLIKKGIITRAGKRGTYIFIDKTIPYSARLFGMILSSLYASNKKLNYDMLKKIVDEAIGFSTVDPFVLADVIVKPSAIAYFSAVDYYGWCIRPPNIIFIQTPVHRAYKNTVKWADWNVVKIGGYYFKPVTVKKDKFFGFEEVEIGGKKVLITDREKTIIDCLDKPRYAGTMEEILDFLRRAEFDPDKLVDYLRRFNNKAVIKRAGYISERFGWGIENKIFSLLTPKDRRSFSLFDPTRSNTGEFNYKWGLRINVPEDFWWETKWM